MMTIDEKTRCDARALELENDVEYQELLWDIKSVTANIKSTQFDRIREANRCFEKKDGSKIKNFEDIKKVVKTSDSYRQFSSSMLENLKKMEESWEEYLLTLLKKHPVYTKWLKNVTGVGPAVAGTILANFSPEKIYYIGQMFSYAGIIGDSTKRKGIKINYNPYLKMRLLGVMGESLIKTKSEYAIYYYCYRIRKIQQYMAMTEEEKKTTSLIRMHRQAIRYAVQRFVKDYYIAFRTIMNIPVIKSYEEEKLGIVHTGNEYTSFKMYYEQKPAEKKIMRDNTKQKIAELKAQLDDLVKLSGLKKSSSEKNPIDEN